MRKRWTWIIILLLTGLVAKGQPYGLAGLIKLGISSSPTTGHTYAHAWPSVAGRFKNHFTTGGAEALYRSGKKIFSMEGFLGRQVIQEGNREVFGYSGSSHVRMGYLVFDAGNFWVYPSLGAGLHTSGLTYTLSNSDETITSESRYLLAPSLDAGLHLDLLAGKKGHSHYDGLVIGFRAGYRMSPAVSWKDGNNLRVSSLPSTSTRDFYLMICLGAGGFSF